MKINNVVRNLSLSLLVVACTSVVPAFAQVNINIRIAPPAQVVEVAPSMAPGHVWVPGHWAWHDDRYVWIRGRTVVQRVGYIWVPDRWEQRGQTYYRNPGRWERDTNYKPVKVKKAKKPKHWENDKHDGPGKGKGNKGNKGNKGKGH